jgi:hypothetical protein
MNNFEIRKSIYDDIRKNCNLITDSGILLEVGLSWQQVPMLKLSVENYILKTLESYYEMKFERGNFLVEYKDKVLGLPNRTPNGAFYPKAENIEQYNVIQKIVNSCMVETKLADQLDSFDVCTIRIVDGAPSKLDDRMSSTTKLHSDAWSGHNGDAILTIGLLGDESTTLEFNEVTKVKSDSFFETQQDYQSGMKMVEEYKTIKNLEFNNMTIFDHACLHKTIKNNGGLRVSIDFGITTKKSKGIVKKNPIDKNVVHKDIQEVLQIGHTKQLTATETLKECYERIKNDSYKSVPNAHVSDNIKWS